LRALRRTGAAAPAPATAPATLDLLWIYIGKTHGGTSGGCGGCRWRHPTRYCSAQDTAARKATHRPYP
jgi:hypothetical protein